MGNGTSAPVAGTTFNSAPQKQYQQQPPRRLNYSVTNTGSIPANDPNLGSARTVNMNTFYGPTLVMRNPRPGQYNINLNGDWNPPRTPANQRQELVIRTQNGQSSSSQRYGYSPVHDFTASQGYSYSYSNGQSFSQDQKQSDSDHGQGTICVAGYRKAYSFRPEKVDDSQGSKHSLPSPRK